MIDLTKAFVPETTVEIELKHPTTEEGLGIYVSLFSSSSEVVKNQLRKQNDVNVSRTQKGKKITAEILEKQALELCAVKISNWRWENKEMSLGEFGADPECNEKTRLALVSVDPFFDQIEEAASKLSNFTKT